MLAMLCRIFMPNRNLYVNTNTKDRVLNTFKTNQWSQNVTDPKREEWGSHSMFDILMECEALFRYLLSLLKI